jgi:hypothetical protein
VAIHEEVLRTARRLCRERRGWTFTPEEVVRSLPHLNASSVRTHIVSRCCIDAPKNHPHKWDYFRRVRRGVYEIVPACRRDRGEAQARRVAEGPATYGSAPLRDIVHATISRGASAYVAECWEVAVVTQGRTLDEVVATRGSHAKLRRLTRDDQRQTLTVPLHKDLDVGTILAIYRQAARFIPESDLRTEFYSD